jgi:threonine aldolase
VVFFDTKLADDFIYRRMRGGQLVSKHRYIGAQMLAYLNGGSWLETARTANSLARRLAGGLSKVPGIRIPLAVDANMVFAIMPRRLHQKFEAAGVKLHLRHVAELAASATSQEVVARLVLSFATPVDSIDKLVALAHDL